MFKALRLSHFLAVVLGGVILLTTTPLWAVCKSKAYEKEAAMTFCKHNVSCADNEELQCLGDAGNWVCLCKHPNLTIIYENVDKPTPLPKKVLHEKKEKHLEIKKQPQLVH